MSTDVNDVDPIPLDVVIPTKNRPGQLHETLQSLAVQSHRCFGVIVVDDGGSVEARTLVPQSLHQQLSIRFVRNDTSVGAGVSRNRGVAAATAPYIVFIDDDCVAEPALVERHLHTLESSAGPVVSLGPILSPRGEHQPVWATWDADRMEREYRKLECGEVRPEWTHLFTGNVGVRRADFLGVGGFDQRFRRGEDIELGYRLAQSGCEFRFSHEAVVFHHSQRDLRSWLRISAATAWFDVEWDRLVPEARRMSAIDAGAREQHWALRVTRNIVRGPVSQRIVAGAALGAGIALHAASLDRLALPAISVARDITYRRAMRDATAAQREMVAS